MDFPVLATPYVLKQDFPGMGGHPIQSPWDWVLAIPLTLAPGVGSVGVLWGFIFPRLLFLGPHPLSLKLGCVGQFPLTG